MRIASFCSRKITNKGPKVRRFPVRSTGSFRTLTQNRINTYVGCVIERGALYETTGTVLNLSRTPWTTEPRTPRHPPLLQSASTTRPAGSVVRFSVLSLSCASCHCLRIVSCEHHETRRCHHLQLPLTRHHNQRPQGLQLFLLLDQPSQPTEHPGVKQPP
ncbi:hypothetical protein FIBSPDRAFT_184454 [Athelia psychrophila]|uniref:Uncharacterized protein n=1 Tax=Athelia psychrophila TaxID=1759441 RepID=A0A166AG08_9AGAM|nr:hypothetical protein FIBSPDRAFT_184454 [Fibularhizoctonia sp. CBS 109695]